MQQKLLWVSFIAMAMVVVACGTEPTARPPTRTQLPAQPQQLTTSTPELEGRVAALETRVAQIPTSTPAPTATATPTPDERLIAQRKAELTNVQTATDAYFADKHITGTIPGSPIGSVPTTVFGNRIAALNLATFYPDYIRIATAGAGVGYCWDHNGLVKQVLVTSTC